MLTGKLVRVRFARDHVVPVYLAPDDAEALHWARELSAAFRTGQGRSRGELEADVAELLDGLPNPTVPQGLAKLLEDRSEFEVQTVLPPEELRDAVFRAAAEARRQGGVFPRDDVLADVG